MITVAHALLSDPIVSRLSTAYRPPRYRVTSVVESSGHYKGQTEELTELPHSQLAPAQATGI